MTLDRKILLGFLLCSVALIIVAIISFRNSRQFLETNQLVNNTHVVLYELEQILVSTVNAETGARGFVITGRETYLEPFDSAKVSGYRHIERARQLTVRNDELQNILEDVRRLIDLRFKHLEDYISLRKKTGFEEAKAIVDSGTGKQLQDQIRIRIGRAREILEALLTERKQASETDAGNFNLIFIILLSVVALTLIAVYIMISINLKALRKAERETAEKNWNLTGSGELIKDMQGNKLVREIAQIIINHLAGYLKAQVGAIYVADDSNVNLILEGTFACDKKKMTTSKIRFGEGVVGQCATEKRMLSLTNIPKDYFNIDTGFGEVYPQHILAVPFLFGERVIGVIELGSMYRFTDLHVEFLKMVADSISIAVTSSQSREKTRVLLEETQRQSEELEAQQEELRQSNDELHAKTNQLEKSEGILKLQQEELQQSNIELEEKANLLEEQKSRLENAKKEIEDKAHEIEVTSKYKSEFLANMSHELRTPLNSILILAQILEENKNKALGRKEIEYARNIHNSGTDLLNLIDEILDLSKVESGKMQLEITEVSLQEVVRNMRSMFAEIAKTRQIEFSIHYDRALKTVATDRQRLEQIIKNLLSNAFKFTDKGGRVSLSINKVIGDTLENDKIRGEALTFSVADSGIGIPSGKQSIIFEAFQQADGSTKRKYGGTGLGLSISRELAFALGGTLHLESEEGKGSTFTLIIPLQFDPDQIAPLNKKVELKHFKVQEAREEVFEYSEEQAIDDDRTRIGENDRKILIIEDDVQFAYVLLDFVRQRNYKGIISYQGNTGISYARHYKPDAILLDLKLPVMDGTEVLKQIKNDPDLRHIPVQIISAFDRKQEGLELGAFDYLPKPVSTTELKAVFDKIENFSKRAIKKLLIVEDNKSQNKAIRELIGNNDVKCFSAYSGTEASELMNGDVFDCVIIDLGLPDMSGFDLLERIKANPILCKIPIVVYTGRDLKKQDNEKLNKLANTVVLKTADSHERLLDETILFLHRVESKLPRDKQNIIRKLHKADEVLQGKLILLVDDDIRNIYSLTNALEEEGVSCITAENGKIALETLVANPGIDLVLMDIMMPEMDGYEATISIRKMEEVKKLPIIALTAKAMKGDKEKCLAVGMSDYISKPVNIEQLLSLLRVWLYK